MLFSTTLVEAMRTTAGLGLPYSLRIFHISCSACWPVESPWHMARGGRQAGLHVRTNSTARARNILT